MVDIIQSLLIVFFEMICCRIFFDTFFRNNAGSLMKLVQIVLLTLCMTMAALVLNDSFWLRQFIAINIEAWFMYWMYKDNLKKIYVLTFFFQGILLAIDSLVLAVTSRFFVNEALPESEYIVPAMMVVAFGKIFLFLCVLIIQRLFGKKIIGVITGKDWIKLLCFPAFTILILSLLSRFFTHLENPEQADVLFIIAFGLIGLNVVVLYLINGIIKREMQMSDDRLLKLQMENQMTLYHSMAENLEKQRMQTHEFKNRILCISSLLEQNDYGKLTEYVGGIYRELNARNDSINTNNAIANAILNTKYQEALQKDILFVLQANDLTGLTMEDDDLVTVLSNLLNNAIEACEACRDGTGMIKMKLLKDKDEIVISVKNTYANEVHEENNRIITSKTTDVEEHGIGVKNILRIVKKYGGSHLIKYDGKEFSFSIIIPCQEKNSK